MFFSAAVKDIAEIFLIRTPAIHFLGTIITPNDGEAVAGGVVNLGNGEKVAFYSTNHESAILSEKLMSICQSIAEFYEAEVFHYDFQAADGIQ
jgi:hypothetical protein